MELKFLFILYLFTLMSSLNSLTMGRCHHLWGPFRSDSEIEINRGVAQLGELFIFRCESNSSTVSLKSSSVMSCSLTCFKRRIKPVKTDLLTK